MYMFDLKNSTYLFTVINIPFFFTFDLIESNWLSKQQKKLNSF